MPSLPDGTTGTGSHSGSAPFPPDAVLRDFLGADEVGALMAHANRNEAAFVNSTT
jgi:hypothetical protein